MLGLFIYDGACISYLPPPQYVRIMRDQGLSTGIKATADGTHFMQRTKVARIYKRRVHLRAVQLLLNHTRGTAGRAYSRKCKNK